MSNIQIEFNYYKTNGKRNWYYQPIEYQYLRNKPFSTTFESLLEAVTDAQNKGYTNFSNISELDLLSLDELFLRE